MNEVGSVTNGDDMPTISALFKASSAVSGVLIPPLAINGTVHLNTHIRLD